MYCDRENATVVPWLLQYAEHCGLVREGVDGEGVVTRLQVSVVKSSIADVDAVYAQVHGDVAQIDGQEGGVGDEDFTVGVGAVGKGFSEEAEGEDFEAGESVEA